VFWITYFKSQGYEENEFLDILPTVLEEHRKSWFRHKKTRGYIWQNFRTDFTTQYDNASETHRREQYLSTRKQRDDEPVEAFIWEMFDLGRQVHALETVAVTVQRCKQALVPRLRLAIGELSQATPECLIMRCKEVLRDLKDVDRTEGRHSRLPPSTPNANHSNWKDRDHGWKRNNFNREQYGNRQNYHNRQPNPGHQQQNSSTNDDGQRRTDRFNNQAAPAMTKKEFRRETRPRYGHPPPRVESRHAEKECYTCRKKGHISRDCPSTAFFMNNGHDERCEAEAFGAESQANQHNLN